MTTKRGWRTGDQTQESPAAQLSHHVAWCEEGWVSGNSTSMWTRVIMALVHIYTETQERIPRPIIWILMRLMATSSVTQPPQCQDTQVSSREHGGLYLWS